MSTAAGAGSVWNANSWHWEEKNYSTWAKEYLKEKLLQLAVESGSTSVKITEVRELEGTASVNIRKGKKVVLFELKFKCRWEGKEGDKTCKGNCNIPELFQDDIDDLEPQISSDIGSAPGAVKLMKSAGTEALKALFTTFVADLQDRDGGEQALAADAARRAEEAAKRDMALKTGAEAFAAASAAVEAAEARRREEEAAKAAAAAGDSKVPEDEAPAGEGSVWNVNSYHWEEKQFTPWFVARLREVLIAIRVSVPGCEIKIPTVGLRCEASTSIRKGKRHTFFELSGPIQFEGELMDGDGNVLTTGDGEITVNELDQSNWQDGIKLTIKGTSPSDGDKRITAYMSKHGLRAVEAALKRVIEELLAKE